MPVKWSGNRKLRIAQLAPLWARIPPRGYGGTERVVHALTEALVRRGHQVTLFAAAGSVTSACLRPGSPAPLWELKGADTFIAQLLQVEDVIRHSAEFDIVHSHLDGLPWLAGERFKAPLINTLHGRLDLPAQRALLAAYRGQPLISISDSQRRPTDNLHLNWVATIHHGLELAQTYKLGKGDGGYLAFVGRIAPEKDPVTAIRVAIRAGIPLRIAARVDPADEEYHQQRIVPYLSHPLIKWLGEIDESAKAELLAGARALLMPIDWEEPFGLSFIEALASGTPVIARPRGSLPEILVHGVHGFLVETEEELLTAVRRAGSLNRAACRAWALERFSVERMVDDYERAYLAVLEMGRVAQALPIGMAVKSA
jgi:glycosyltransferase involved in cell wall biosynthesis